MPARRPARPCSRKPLAALGPGPRNAPPRSASVAHRRLIIASITAIVAAAGVLVGPSVAGGATEAGSPVGKAERMIGHPGGVRFVGWAVDPSTRSPATVVISVDRKEVASTPANRARQQPVAAADRGFDVSVPISEGKHTLCASVRNISDGADTLLRCLSTTLDYGPLGAVDEVTARSGSVHVKGWAFDKDAPTSPIDVTVEVDQTSRTLSATRSRPDVADRWSYAGEAHGFDTSVPVAEGTHRVCVQMANIGYGTDNTLDCRTVTLRLHPVAPEAPRGVKASPTSSTATVTWTAPVSDGGAPVSGYVVTWYRGTRTIQLPASARSTTITGLLPGRSYFVRVRAVNVAGESAVGYSAWFQTQSGLPPQRTPAPVSTSRYIRNVRGSSAAELAMMRREGAADARSNPTGHRYLVLLDIGGQDQYDGGVVLSATTRFVTYRDLVRDVQAYTAGYHSAQRSGAPVTIAIGTNNDMDVSYTSGKAWAQSVINPIASYTRSYSSMSIVGANDIEPGFRASYSQTKRWLLGYLAGTTRPFVFNGSADGCAWTATGRSCNNGWTMAGLYYLAAGAAPTRMVNLPQIYNYTMADQWKYISLTGIGQGRPRIVFGGPLTEWTACAQDGGCGSLTGRSAWARLWENLQSDGRLKVTSLPYSTDLRIDR